MASAVVTYAGMAIGAVNFIVLFPRFFSTEHIGLVRLLLSLSLVYTQVSQFGLINVLYKYYPVYRPDASRLRSFVFWLYALFAAGFVGVAAMYVVAKPWLVAIYSEKSALYGAYYYHLIPLCLSLSAFNLFEGFAASRLQTVASGVIKEVGLRLMTTVAIGLYAAGRVDFETFVEIYVLLHALGAAMQLLFAWRGLDPPSHPRLLKREELREMIRFGAYSMLSTGAVLMMTNTDTLMLGAMTGLSAVGVYGVYLNVATVVSIPGRAIVRISYPVITRAFAQNDLQEIATVYRKTVEAQTALALWVFLGIAINGGHLTALLKGADYARAFGVYLLLGGSFVINAAFGVNHYILAASERYRYELYLNVGALALNVALNYAMIRVWGAQGAAGASAVSMLALNAMKWAVLKRYYGFQPFNASSLLPYVAAVPAAAVGYFFPVLPGWLFDLVCRSLAFSLVFWGLCLWFRASPDINVFVRAVIRKAMPAQKTRRS
jgi:O-antigen/teichoic acid export membrane protein